MQPPLPTFHNLLPLARALSTHQRILAITGAGISTDSGIPDYRGPARRHKPYKPINIKQFTQSKHARNRYWARSFIGFPRFIKAEPNQAHLALPKIQAIDTIITQNVDSLHAKAGSHNVIELHGHLRSVRCMDCGATEDRMSYQSRLRVTNLTLLEKLNLADDVENYSRLAALKRPDGDVEISQEVESELYSEFIVSCCLQCGGDLLRPEVVFFGENVVREVGTACDAAVVSADCLLVLGTSLSTWSSYRLVLRAVEIGLPVYIVNHGCTRGDNAAVLKLDYSLGPVLSGLSELLLGDLSR